MNAVALIIQALQILAPLVEDIVKALSTGKMPDFVSTLPDPQKLRVKVAAHNAGIK
jgi:hypothetical protein